MESFLVFCGCLLFAGLIEAGSMQSGSMGSVCECVAKHPQEHYCEADFVIRGFVAGRNYSRKEGMPDMGPGMDMMFNYYTVYKVQIEKVFRGASYFSEGMDVYIKTEADKNMCGIDLMNRKLYLISGQKEDGTMLNISGCNWIKKYKELTQAQKSGVKRQYGANCDSCQIEACNKSHCKASSNTKCAYNSTAAGACHENFSYCVAKKNGICKWNKKRDEMKDCLQTSSK